MGKTRRSNKTYGLKKTKVRIPPKSDGAGEQVLALQKPLNETLDEIETFAKGVLKYSVPSLGDEDKHIYDAIFSSDIN